MIARRLALAAWVAALLFVNTAEAQPASSESTSDVTAPKLLSDPGVSYPEGAKGDATVILTLLVGPDGSVQSATPVELNEPFSTLAAQAALGWRFEPATRDGKPVAVRIRVEVVFTEPVVEQQEPSDPPASEPTPGGDDAVSGAAPKPIEELEVTVQGNRPEPSRTASLSRAEVRQIPGTFGDPFRAIEALPGVTPIVSGLPFFYIRGAPPGNTGYFLDGIRVPLLFHVGAGPSVVHPALIERVDLYPGGYPARFGRFAGGIVSGETLDPSGELHGEYNLRLFDAGAFVEVPFDEGRGSALAGGRYSYTALLFSLLSPDTTLDYWDYQTGLSYALTPEDRIGVLAFGSHDFLGERAETETLTLFSTEFHRVDLRFDRQLEQGRWRSAFTLGIDSSTVQQDRSVRDRLVATRTELEYRVIPSALVRAGTSIAIDYYDVELGPTDLSPVGSRLAAYFPTRTDLAVGGHADVIVDVDPALEVTPGLRADLYGSDGATAFAFEPRLALRAEASERVHLLSAFGIAHQPPSFVVPVPGIQPGGLRGGLQRSLQESFGVEIDLGDATTLTTTVFQNAFFNMSDPLGAATPQVQGCPPGSFPSDSLGGDRSGDLGGDNFNAGFCGARFEAGTLGPDRTGGGDQAADGRGGRRVEEVFQVRTLGSSYGLEVFLKRRLTSKLGGYLSYTLSRSTRSHGRRTYLAAFDRTHVANAAVAYNLGRNWRAGTRLIFYTGLPKAPDPTDPDSTRLPPFFRADVRIEKRWQLGKTSFVALVGEWMNATLSTEAIATRCTLEGCEAQTIGPVTIPSIGVEGGF